MRSTRTIQIDAPAEQVFAYITDIPRQPRVGGEPARDNNPAPGSSRRTVPTLEG